MSIILLGLLIIALFACSYQMEELYKWRVEIQKLKDDKQKINKHKKELLAQLYKYRTKLRAIREVLK